MYVFHAHLQRTCHQKWKCLFLLASLNIDAPDTSIVHTVIAITFMKNISEDENFLVNAQRAPCTVHSTHNVRMEMHSTVKINDKGIWIQIIARNALLGLGVWARRALSLCDYYLPTCHAVLDACTLHMLQFNNHFYQFHKSIFQPFFWFVFFF